MLWAAAKDKTYDTICVMTDNETWAGAMHPHQALREYRNRVGVDTREVVVGMTVTDFTIADPNDPGTLDIAGFDSAVPNLISDFSRGDV
jgi:60 kDa SS-A/Ro ribonucleoprotein